MEEVKILLLNIGVEISEEWGDMATQHNVVLRAGSWNRDGAFNGNIGEIQINTSKFS